jgi:hypothetical protein
MVLLIQSASLDHNKISISEAIGITFERRMTLSLAEPIPVPPAEWQNPY